MNKNLGENRTSINIISILQILSILSIFKETTPAEPTTMNENHGTFETQ
jgi:hypothetical protein